MSELEQRKIEADPWGRTLAGLAQRGWSGRLSVVADERRFSLTFAGGKIVDASSPLATDAAVRVARISALISSTQVSEILRRSTPDRDELELIIEYAKLSSEQAAQLRRSVLARRAARTFSLERGEVIVNEIVVDHASSFAGAALDVREVIYLGARENMSELRLAADRERQGAWFRLRPNLVAELSAFGFGDDARPILDLLTKGATLGELETCKARIEKRLVSAVVYALTTCDACEVLAAKPELALHTVEADELAPRPHTSSVDDDDDGLAPRPAGYVPRSAGERDTQRAAGYKEYVTPLDPRPPARKPAHRDLVGVTIGERYVVEEKLGVGKMGTVYRAHHTKLTRLFALKVLHRNLLANEEAVRRFEREAAVSGSLHQTNVIGVVDVGTTEGVPYLAMEYAEGITLAAILGEGPLLTARAIRLLRQICAGLAYAHGTGIIHRDFKPENVIVETTLDDEIPRIADFGTAILLEADDSKRLTAVGMVLGTPSYMAPEQAAGLAVDHRVDLYALGVIMYQMLTGVLPFTGTNVDIVSAALREAPPKMRVRAPDVAVDPLLEALTYALLAKSPDARPRDANEVKLLLELIEQDREAAAARLGVRPAPIAAPPTAPVPIAPVVAPPVIAPPVVASAVATRRPTDGEGTKTLAMWQLTRDPIPDAAPIPAPMPAPMPLSTERDARSFARVASGTAIESSDSGDSAEWQPPQRSRWLIATVITAVVVVGIVIAVTQLGSGLVAKPTTKPVAPPGSAQTVAPTPVPPPPPVPPAPIETSSQKLTALYATVGRELATLRARVGRELTEDLMRRYRLVQLKDARSTPPRRAVAMTVLEQIRADAAQLRDASNSAR